MILAPTTDRTSTPCIGRRSLNHWTVSEVPNIGFYLGILLNSTLVSSVLFLSCSFISKIFICHFILPDSVFICMY